MTASVRGAQLRKDLAAFRERSRRGSYPGELRARAAAYAAERARGGAATAEIAEELGVREVTASRWIAAAPEKAPGLSLIPLVIGDRRADARRPRLRIDLPDGTRVHASGLALSDVVEAIQALRRPR
jgi:transposase-like protein